MYFIFKNGEPFKDFQQLRVIIKLFFGRLFYNLYISKTGEGRGGRKRHHLKRHDL